MSAPAQNLLRCIAEPGRNLNRQWQGGHGHRRQGAGHRLLPGSGRQTGGAGGAGDAARPAFSLRCLPPPPPSPPAPKRAGCPQMVRHAPLGRSGQAGQRNVGSGRRRQHGCRQGAAVAQWQRHWQPDLGPGRGRGCRMHPALSGSVAASGLLPRRQGQGMSAVALPWPAPRHRQSLRYGRSGRPIRAADPGKRSHACALARPENEPARTGRTARAGQLSLAGTGGFPARGVVGHML